MTLNLRRAALALLVAAPAVAGAQQQQGTERLSDPVSRARTLVEKKRYKAALALLDSLVRADPGSRDGMLGRAQILAQIGRVADAVRAYERWVASHPRDVAIVERLAQALAWAGRLDDAERIHKVLAAGGSQESERALARIAAWRGEYFESERQWRAILARRPDDAEAWVGLAQVLRWTNRPREARAALVRAVQADPGHREAKAQLDLVNAALAPRVEPSVSSLEDTDGNRVTTVGASAAVAPPWDGELSVRVQHRAAANGAARASSLGAAATVSRATGRLALRASLGGARLDDGSMLPGSAPHAMLTASATASAALGERGTVAVGAGREPFDETAAIIRNGIVTTTIGAGGVANLTRRVTGTARVEHARLTGATPNSRTTAAGSIRWRAPHVLSLVTNVHTLGYAVDPGEGYFAPRRYVLADAGAQLALGRELGWSVTLDGGFGAQAVSLRGAGSETQPASRVSLAIGYRPTPAMEWALTGHVANAVSPATTAFTSYRASGWALRARVSF